MDKNTIQFSCSQLGIEKVIEKFASNSTEGLSDGEVKIRLKKYGLNRLKGKKIFWFETLFKQFINPFNVLFFVISFISFLVHEYENGTVIMICIFINVMSSFYQEYRAILNLEALKSYLIHMTTLIRNGKELKVDSTKVVPGDIIILTPGNILPADIRLLETEDLEVDESVLTGESKSVKKTTEVLTLNKPDIFSITNIGFAGSSVVHGKAKGIIIATSKETIMGSIFELAMKSELQKSYLAQQLSQLSIIIFFLVFGILIITFLINIFLKGGTFNFFEFFIFSTALAITAIPEALPVVVTFALSKGINILAKKKVIVKRLSAMEDLGRMDILCVDKTGTLTENTQSVAKIEADDKNEIIFSAALASESSYTNLEKLTKGFDSAIWHALKEGQKKQLQNYKKVKDVPFESKRKRNTVIVQTPDNKCILISRGMPEEILKRSKVDKEKEKKFLVLAQKEGTLGHRVLAIAKKEISLHEISAVDKAESNLEFLGFISFSDPLKKTAVHAIQISKKLGVSLKILSGDSREVCSTIAQQAALIKSDKDVLTGYEFADLNKAQKKQVVNQYCVFARIDPEQKFEIIQLLQKQKYYVGYVGDGINDVPALKIANVAIAVPNATDIARDVADIILIRKSLLVIVNGIEEGRTIIANIFKYIKTTLSANFGNFFSLSFSTFFLHYLPMLPIQLLMVNLISDFPMIAIATDNVASSEVKKLKKNYLKELMVIAVILGIVSSMFDFIFLNFFKGYGIKIVHTGWFIFSIFTELVFIFSIRTEGIFYKTKRPSLWLVCLSTFAAIMSISLVYLQKFEFFLHLAPLSINQLSLLAVLLLFYFVTTEVVKNYYYAKRSKV